MGAEVETVTVTETVIRAKEYKKVTRHCGASAYYFFLRSFIISFSRYISLLSGLKSRESAITL